LSIFFRGLLQAVGQAISSLPDVSRLASRDQYLPCCLVLIANAPILPLSGRILLALFCCWPGIDGDAPSSLAQWMEGLMVKKSVRAHLLWPRTRGLRTKKAKGRSLAEWKARQRSGRRSTAPGL